MKKHFVALFILVLIISQNKFLDSMEASPFSEQDTIEKKQLPTELEVAMIMGNLEKVKALLNEESIKTLIIKKTYGATRSPLGELVKSLEYNFDSIKSAERRNDLRLAKALGDKLNRRFLILEYLLSHEFIRSFLMKPENKDFLGEIEKQYEMFKNFSKTSASNENKTKVED